MMQRRKAGTWQVAALAALVLWGPGGCQKGPRSEAHASIACVNDAPILLQDWQREVRRARSENLDSQGPNALPKSGLQEHGRAVLDDMIVRRLLVQAADKQQLSVSQDEIEAGYMHLQDGWPSALFSEVIAHEDFSVSELRNLVRETLLIRKYMRDFVFARLAVTDAQIETYAQSHPEVLTRPELIRLSQIVVPTQEQAITLVQSIRRGKAFADMAQAHSQGPQARHGGDLGVLPRGVLPEAFERVVFSLPIRTLSPIVAGPDGFHLFWVSEHTLARSFPLAQMRNEVQNSLRRQAEAQAQAAHIAALKQAARITVKESYLVEPSA
jgi:parvulin-like peptidyl-prolyl isomerase